jgi:16S rRNA (adenine1518-N6/adenine1519-N6)-dimethyltransferase
VTAGIRAKKSLGQHWLTDRRYLDRLNSAADFGAEETVIEVGPGKGALTRLLAPRASRLIPVEVDRALAESLRVEFAERPGVRVLHADIRSLDVEQILKQGGGRLPYVVVGNLPYFIGTAIVRKFLAARVRPRWLVVMLQAEVAERMAARPGKMSYLSVETQVLADARVLFRVPARAFKPPPKVQSAVLRLDVHDSPEVEVDDLAAFLELVQAGFAAPRKQLRNSLSIGIGVPAGVAAEILAMAGIDGDLRPQVLTLDDWRAVYLGYRRRAGNR